MKKRVSRSLAAVLCLVMVLSMLTPALAAVPMMDAAAGVEEVSPEDVGTMAHSHGEVVEQRPAVDDTQGDTPAVMLDEAWTHNFTTSGKNSSFYTITGNLSTSKGTVTYNGLTLTQCLKMESATNITFTAPADGTLTLVFVEADGTALVDGTKCTASDQVITVDVAAGEHTIKKSGSDNLFYMVYARKEAEAHDAKWDEGTVTKEPSCTETGTKTFKCTVSGCVDPTHVRTETLATIAHAYENGGVYCTMCGRNKDNASDIHKNHTFGEWVNDKAASCTEEGSRHRTCSNTECNKVETEPIPKSDHNFVNGVCTVCKTPMGAVAGGWFEAMYAEMADVTPAEITGVSWTGASDGSLDAEGLKYLVRAATVKKNGADADGVRIDVPGLTPGSYDLTISMGSSSFTTKGITVLAHDRSGFAHYKYTDGVGAYNDDGTLKQGAKVLYVTEENKNDVTLTVGGTTVKGIGNILNSAGKADNGNNDILKKLADAGKPLVVRIIGRVTAPAGVTEKAATGFGGSVKDNGSMARMKDARNVTLEGIGADAVVDGWGFHFMAGTAGYGKSFEARNLEFRNVPEDCLGMEGNTQSGSNFTDAPVERCWVHNCEFYVPHISNPAESDKAEGDGACDFKRGQYMTMDYCYYEGYHKTNLIGASDDNLQYHVTWHHNYYKNCESRGPLARQADIHIYNTVYDGQSSYCQNPRANCYIFSEYNHFLNSKDPGTLKSGGVIKSYKDVFENVKGDQSATVVTDKNKTVSSACKYANFDTKADMSYIPDGNYQLDTDMTVMAQRIEAYTGTMKPADAITTPDVPEPGPTGHTHQWTGWTKVKDPTCTTAGSEKRTCQADGCPIGTDTRTVAALGHSWGGWVRTKDPDCIHDGQETRECATCHETETQAVAKTGQHVYDENGNCTTEGCDASIGTGGGDTPTPAPEGAYVHNFTVNNMESDFYTITGNLSTSKGEVIYNGMKLTQCLKLESSTTVTFTAPAGGGSLTLVFVESAPTIKFDGAKKTGSNQVITIDTMTAGKHTLTKADTANLFYMSFASTCTHANTQNVAATPATCGAAGYTAGVQCTKCLQFISGHEEIPATGAHTWVQGEDTATCVAAGQRVDTCSVCGATQTVTTPATGKHTYPNGATSGICTVCAYDSTTGQTHTHQWTETAREDASCTQTGSVTHTCSACHQTKTETLPKTAHNWVGDKCSVCGTSKPAGSFTKVGGWFETAYAQWAYMEGASSYEAYYKKAAEGDDKYVKVDDELIRQYPSYMRVDVPGIAAGEYVIKIVPKSGSQPIEGAAMTTEAITVRAHDRSGYAYFAGGSPGGYKADGTPKENARIIYVTEETKDTVTLRVKTDKNEVECKGVQNIILGYKKRKDDRPLIIRIIGNISDPANMPSGDLLIDGAGNGLTIEGIGNDAVCNGFGIVLKGASNVEVRNLGFMNCNSKEGDSLGLQQENDHIWTHNNDYFYGDAGSDTDQAKGDGSLDTKKSTYVTHSYNHFWDSGKTHLLGMHEGSAALNWITYHHNWYDHSDSRHPRVRGATTHVYNNYYDGVAKYGVGATEACSIFVENNYFRGTSKPMMISMQGTDIAQGGGTFSDEDGGAIKSFNNIMVGDGRTVTYKPYSAANSTEFDAYEAQTRNEQVPSSVKAKQGGASYNNFDTDSKLIYDYTPQSPDAVVAEVENWSGRMEGGDLYWEFNDATDDADYSVIPELKERLTNYTTTLVKVGGTVSNGGGTNPPAECTHSSTRWVTTIAATCTAPGTKTQICTSCGVTLGTDSVPATGHSQRWVLTTPPTCGTEGVETSTCSVCNATFGTRAVAATGDHTFENGTCTECGASEGSTPPTPVDPDPPTPPAGNKYVLESKKDVYEKLTSNGSDKNGNPIYTYAKAANVSAGTGNYFTLQYAANAKVDYSIKTWDDNYESDYRVNFGAAATATANSIAFTVGKAPATVKVWWVQGGADGDREIVILDAAGKQAAVTMGDGYVKNQPYLSTLTLTQPGKYALGSTPGNNYIFKVEVTEAADAQTPAEPLHTDELAAAINAANKALSTAVVSSENGADVLPTQQWVSQKTMDDLANAIATAQSVLNNSAAAQDEVDGAVTTLNAAVETFNSAKHSGTKTPDKSELNSAIAAAQAELNAAEVSTDAAFVLRGATWVTQTAKDAYQSAINTAQTVADKASPTDQELHDAVTALSGATADFRRAKGQGTAAKRGNLGAQLWGVDTAGNLKLSGTGAEGGTVVAASWDSSNNFLGAKLLTGSQTTLQLGSYAKVKLLWLDGKYAPKCPAATINK